MLTSDVTLPCIIPCLRQLQYTLQAELCQIQQRWQDKKLNHTTGICICFQVDEKIKALPVTEDQLLNVDTVILPVTSLLNFIFYLILSLLSFVDHTHLGRLTQWLQASYLFITLHWADCHSGYGYLICSSHSLGQTDTVVIGILSVHHTPLGRLAQWLWVSYLFITLTWAD